MKALSCVIFIALLVHFVSAFVIPPQIQVQEPVLVDLQVELHEESTELITNCGDDNDLLEIDYINLNPDPPVRGENLKIEFKGNLKEQVDDGAYVLITVKYGLVQLLKKKFDFCEEIVKVDEQCPLEKGKLVFNKDVELPKEIPPGKYTVEAQIFTNDDKRVTCLHGVTSFPRY